VLEKEVHKKVCEYLRDDYPNVIFFSDWSGVRVAPKVANEMKLLKSSRGIPDILVLEPRGGFYGLCIELKRDGEKLFKRNGTPKSEHIAEQIEMCHRLRERGYYANICTGLEQAKIAIDYYLNMEMNDGNEYNRDIKENYCFSSERQ